MADRAGDSRVGSTLLSLLSSNGGIRYGDSISFSGLALVPLFTERPVPFDYVLLSDAIASSAAVVEEVGVGTVPALRLVNRGDRPVLLVDGEHLVGVKQNRILNSTILVPEKSALDIPVSCVEAGRWGAPVGTARPVSPSLFVSTRARKAEAVTASVRTSGVFMADQAAIWDGVAETMAALEVGSATSAMHAAYEQRAADFGAYHEHLRWQEGQTGVVATVHGRIACVDLFDRSGTLRDLWERLIPSYAVEAVAAPRDKAGAGELSRTDAEAFMRSASRATITAHPAVGRGTDLRLTGGGVVGSALEVERTILHLALFRAESEGRHPRGPRFASVRQRRRGRDAGPVIED